MRPNRAAVSADLACGCPAGALRHAQIGGLTWLHGDPARRGHKLSNGPNRAIWRLVELMLYLTDFVMVGLHRTVGFRDQLAHLRR